MKNKILILTDFKGYIATSLLPRQKGTVSGKLLEHYFKEKGFLVRIESIHDVKPDQNWNGWYVLYPSNEAPGLFYKEFIEDIILRLQLAGAILLPDFYLFRAHHNKVFGELYRTSLKDERLKTIKSYAIYSEKECSAIKGKLSFPLIVKTAQGAGSSGVDIVKEPKELMKKIRKMNRINYQGLNWGWYKEMHFLGGRIKRKLMGQSPIIKTPQREKMILQPFIPNLTCDYKVLVFGEKYFLLKREVRKHDFRASGSGILRFPEILREVEIKVLDLARIAFMEINQPMLSVDIAYDGEKCHMIEFQCISFGPYTLQESKWYFIKKENCWERINARSVLEEEMVNSIVEYVKRKNQKDGLYGENRHCRKQKLPAVYGR